MGDTTPQPHLLDSCYGVAPADDSSCSPSLGGVADRLCSPQRAPGKRLHLEHTHRPIPHNGLGLPDHLTIFGPGYRADVEDAPACLVRVLRHLSNAHGLYFSISAEGRGDYHILR